MDTIRVMYKFYEKNWMADSPDFETLSGTLLIYGGATFEEVRALITEGLPWALERDDIAIEHFVHESSLPKLLSEQEHVTPEPAVTAKR